MSSLRDFLLTTLNDIEHYSEVHKIPKGSSLLLDIGLNDQCFIRNSHDKHKSNCDDEITAQVKRDHEHNA